MTSNILTVRWLGQQDYLSCWEAMRQFTDSRQEDTMDEIWLLEHHPVFTQGQNGKPEHILTSHSIPLVKTDRGGQVTYHGPGQLMVYTLIDIKRKKMHVRELVNQLETAMIDLLAEYRLRGYAKREAPGVYIDQKKIGSIGLRIRRGCAYHGIAFNVAMDLEPFNYINPCGFANLRMTQLSEVVDWVIPMKQTGLKLTNYLMKNLGYNRQHFIDNQRDADGN